MEAVNSKSLRVYKTSEKERADAKAYRESHPEVIRAWREKNSERLAAKGKVWAAANPEKCKLYALKRSCSELERERQRAYRRAHPERRRKWSLENPDKMREYGRVHHLAKFGLTLAAYDALFKKQCGLCAICHRPETSVFKGKVRSLAIDHDHRCCPAGRACEKCIRGLLCYTCNSGIGYLGDDPNRVMAAARYLTERTKVL